MCLAFNYCLKRDQILQSLEQISCKMCKFLKGLVTKQVMEDGTTMLPC